MKYRCAGWHAKCCLGGCRRTEGTLSKEVGLGSCSLATHLELSSLNLVLIQVVTLRGTTRGHFTRTLSVCRRICWVAMATATLRFLTEPVLSAQLMALCRNQVTAQRALSR